MRGIKYVMVATVLFTNFYAAGCSNDAEPTRQRERFARNSTGDIVIGAPWPWSARKELLYGQGLQLAVEQANAEGGVHGRKLQIRQVDDGGATDRARLVAQELADDPSVVAVIGHHQSRVTAAAAPIYDLAGLVLLSATSAIPALPEQGYQYVFQTIFTGHDVGRSMAKFALDRSCTRMAIYYSRDDHGRDLANAFEEFIVQNGGQIVARESTDPAEPAGPLGAARVVTSWQEQLIDAVFLATPYKQAALLAEALRKNGFQGPLVGSDALAARGFSETGGKAVEGTVFATSFSPDLPSPEVQRFRQSFEQRFAKEPSLTAALGYDAGRILVHALRQSASLLPSATADALRAVRDWAGVTGVFNFSNTGTLVDPTVNTAIVRAGQSHALVDVAAAPACTAHAETGGAGR